MQALRAWLSCPLGWGPVLGGGGYRVLAAASLPWFLPCPVPFCTLYATHCPLRRELGEFSQQLGILGPPLELQACVHCAWGFPSLLLISC